MPTASEARSDSSTHAFARNKLGDESIAALKSALAAASPTGEADYALFREMPEHKGRRFQVPGALQAARTIGRSHGPGSPANDRRADSYEGTRSGSNDFAEDRGAETVYSRLRNEHMHRNVPVSQVRSEMETHLPGLIAIVQKAIKNP